MNERMPEMATRYPPSPHRIFHHPPRRFSTSDVFDSFPFWS